MATGDQENNQKMYFFVRIINKVAWQKIKAQKIIALRGILGHYAAHVILRVRYGGVDIQNIRARAAKIAVFMSNK